MNLNHKSDLLNTLVALHDLVPDYRFGQLICNLANLAGDSEIVSVWDVNDEDLLAAARRFLETHPRIPKHDTAREDHWPALIPKL